jgi:hypothetical protein
MKLLEKLALRLLLRAVTPERIISVATSLIVKLLAWARKRDEWDKGKKIVEGMNRLSSIFLDIYADDELTEEDEEKIREELRSIADEENLEALVDRLVAFPAK